VLIALGTSAGMVRITLWGGNVQTCMITRASESGNHRPGGLSHPVLEQAQPVRDNGGWEEIKIFYAAVVDAGRREWRRS